MLSTLLTFIANYQEISSNKIERNELKYLPINLLHLN